MDEQSLPQKEAWQVGIHFSNMKNNAQKRNMPCCSEWTQGLASENFGGLQSVEEPQNDFLSLTPVILGSQQWRDEKDLQNLSFLNTIQQGASGIPEERLGNGTGLSQPSQRRDVKGGNNPPPGVFGETSEDRPWENPQGESEPSQNKHLCMFFSIQRQSRGDKWILRVINLQKDIWNVAPRPLPLPHGKFSVSCLAFHQLKIVKVT